jgi:hypothetical protein
LNIRRISVILLCLVLSACTEAAAPSTPLAQATDAITPATLTPTKFPVIQKPPSSTSTLQPSHTPTSTPRPSHTPSISLPTNTVFVDSRKTLTAQAFDLHDTQVASFSPVCKIIIRASISQSGNWLAISCDDYLDESLEIINREGKRWKLQFADYLAAEYRIDGTRGSLYPEFWTNDESFLYFSSQIGFSGGGTCLYTGGVHGLFRINLNTGEIATTLPVSSSWLGYKIAFSPDGHRLAYITGVYPLIILDMKTSEKYTVSIKEDSVGDLQWSPDGSKLAFATCQPAQKEYEISKSTIQIFSINSHTSITILEVVNEFLTITSSVGEQMFEIMDLNILENNYSYVLFDWSSGQLSTATPEP